MLSHAARRGSVSAMGALLKEIRPEDPPPSSPIDQLARRRGR
jgi:hypothetical protein